MNLKSKLDSYFGTKVVCMKVKLQPEKKVYLKLMLLIDTYSLEILPKLARISFFTDFMAIRYLYFLFPCNVFVTL